MRWWLTREILNLWLSQRGESWRLPDSAFFHQEFCSVYSIYLIFCPVKGPMQFLYLTNEISTKQKTPTSNSSRETLHSRKKLLNWINQYISRICWPHNGNQEMCYVGEGVLLLFPQEKKIMYAIKVNKDSFWKGESSWKRKNDTSSKMVTIIHKV